MFNGKKWQQLLKILLVSGLCASIFFTPLPQVTMAATDPLAEYKKQQQELKEQMEAQQKLINEKNQQKKSFLSQIADLDAQINRMKADKAAANVQLEVAQDQIDEANKLLTETQKRLDERKGTLEQRVRDIYVNGDISMMEVLFESESFSDFISLYDMLERIMDKDTQLLDGIKEDQATIENQKSLLEERQSELIQLKANRQASIQELDSLQGQKEQMLGSVEQQKAQLEAAFEEMEQESSDIAYNIRKLQAAQGGSSSPYNGVFSWPLPGHTTVTSEYGMRMHPILKVKKMHTGIDISAPNGTSIKAVEAGTVIFAGWGSAYGNYVIIDHGGNVASMYAHMSSMSVSVGQKIAKGAEVGKVGSTGWSTGNHLHFEVRVNGSPVNPWTYLK